MNLNKDYMSEIICNSLELSLPKYLYNSNFIVNNITYAEASTIIIEKATETAEYIVEHSLDPNNFKSPTARKKLQRKISELKNGVVKIKQTSKTNPKIIKSARQMPGKI